MGYSLSMVSLRWLILTAAFVWFTGSVILFVKAIALYKEAYVILSSFYPVLLSSVLAICVGLLKARFLFDVSCRRNIERIEGLESPRFYLFYKPIFFIFMAMMIACGVALSELSHGNSLMLLMVGGLDLSLATALLRSGRIYFK